jgi:putative metallohydrolase (TIGR04338 family)
LSTSATSPDPGDPQREPLYRCEQLALPDGGRRFRRFSELEQYVQSVVLGPWWEHSFPEAPIEVTVLRRSSGATFSAAHVTPDGAEAVVWVRAGSWDAVTVVHELAHVAVGRASGQPVGQPVGGSAPHGAEFAGALLVCWRELLGVQAYGALRSAFDTNGIEYRRDRLG